jgi:PAS domain S-box-containing protein
VSTSPWQDPALLQQLVERAPEAVVIADRDGTIRFWNASAETIFGFAQTEAIGQSLDLIIPEPQRARHWEGYRTVMQSGTTKYGRELLAVPALRRDGTRISLEFSVVLLRDADENVDGIAAIIRDVTAAWQRERGLRQRLAELEAQVRAIGEGTTASA